MYNHPYEPYNIQVQFMNTLYQLLKSSKKLGIFESPTGTGKTLSLLCPSITWLRNLDKINLDSELAKVDALKGAPFVKAAARKSLLKKFQAQGDALKQLHERTRGRVIKRKGAIAGPQYKKQRVDPTAQVPEDFVLEDPLVDQETVKLLGSVLKENDGLLDKLSAPNKIFFTSRTHSQLAQFVDALKQFKLEASWSDEKQPVKHVSLGSRKQLCTNPTVASLGSVQKINDKCSDLRQKKACPYFEADRQQLTEEIITEVMDIEDLAKTGRESKTCAYYAARDALPYAEVVTLPYQLLVDEGTRKALKLDVKGSLVIIDEAHNIMDVITSMNSLTISHSDVDAALNGLKSYEKKVGNRLSSRNKTKLGQTILLVESISSFFKSSSSLAPKETAPGTPISLASLFTTKNVDMLDLYGLKKWFEESRLVYKIDSYIKQAETDKTGNHPQQSDENRRALVLGKVVDFLSYASDPSKEGKLYYDSDKSISFLALDPSPPFQEIVEKAAKVVLAGGTMEPVADYVDTLVPELAQEDIEMFSCGHIIPSSNLLVRVINTMEFTFASRQDKAQMSRLGSTIYQLTTTVPAGLVVFFPSYKFLDTVVQAWKQEGIYAKLGAQKRIFTEDKSKSAESILDGYAKHIKGGQGALMFAVVGGKLSEGINFSDDLARGVAMVGLPFPNAFSAEMIAKKEYIESRCIAKGLSKSEATQVARDHYENLSMRAVNQSVGRAIRHIKDYAAIYLIDKRYEQERIKSKLSRWIRDEVRAGEWREDTKGFFEGR